MFEHFNILSSSNNSPYWFMLMGTSGSELIRGIDIDSTNNIYLYGDFNDYKLDIFGNVLWQKTTPLNPTGSYGLGSAAIGVDNAGYHYVRYIKNSSPGIIKVDNLSGDVVNAVTFSLTSSGQAAYISDIATDSNNNVYACGYFTPSGGSEQIYLVKLNSSLSIVWQKIINHSTSSSDSESTEQLYVDFNDNVYLTSTISGSTTYSEIYKFDSSGSMTISKKINNTIIRGVTVDSSSNIILLLDIPPISPDIFNNSGIIKLNSTGTVSWQKSINATNDPESGGSGGIDVDIYNNIYIHSNATYFSYICKFDTNGNNSWSTKLSNGSTRNWSAGNLIIDKDNTLIVTGSTNIVGGSGSDDGYALRVPTGGERTGSFTIGSGTFNYQSFSPSIANTSLTITNASGTVTSPSYTTTSETLTFTTSTDIFTKVEI